MRKALVVFFAFSLLAVMGAENSHGGTYFTVQWSPSADAAKKPVGYTLWWGTEPDKITNRIIMGNTCCEFKTPEIFYWDTRYYFQFSTYYQDAPGVNGSPSDFVIGQQNTMASNQNRFFVAQAIDNAFTSTWPLTWPTAKLTGTPMAGYVTDNNYTSVVMFNPTTGKWYVDDNNVWWEWLSNFGIGSQKQFLADVNGDLLDDVVIFNASTGNWYVALNREDHFEPQTTPWLTGYGIGSKNQFVDDVNGDGKADVIVYFEATGVAGNWYVALNKGTYFDWGTKPVPTPWLTGYGIGSKNQFVADVNDDGKADVIVYFETPGLPGNWYIALNKGTYFDWGTKPVPTPWLTNWGSGSTSQLLTDINGDGKADVVTFFKQ